MTTGLAMPLSDRQIEAAGRLYQQLHEWQLGDRALVLLHERFPGFGPEASMLKTVTINALYGTNVYAFVRMAAHVEKEMAKPNTHTAGPELVERLASLPPAPTQRQSSKRPRVREHLSFASKFANFFIDSNRFPIYDYFALKMLKYHLGKRNYVKNQQHRYLGFVRNLNEVKKLAGLSATNKELDRYLWLAGEYTAWSKNNEAQVSSMLRKCFEEASGEVQAQLRSLLS